ncbi:MAG: mannosyl-3-phosphoglycerate synthase [Candidatus Nitrosocaldus sp.]|nr:mannosyl-3-phosphoglycerate synthase [Candidatus Nitrosocaldus sp.]MCS7140766.1 mannosyl-3-phosphoglycerate synthase [Candidatus Nitrosocaldus sp.]MDW7999418.1 mannosyl-3-phosphoglycerate synthase [Candidatus Nitrosocaldus sp.]MDW8275003.1 mannosyl-3-phosphoglycerate synthase [Candidatus Nitrosocaldus sp.]
MKLDYARYSERFGALTINSVQHVHELDSGNAEYHRSRTVAQVSERELYDVYSRLAIVVPVKNERLKLLEGVISGIPHDCLVIVVSNSSRSPVDRYKLERDTLKHHVLLTDRDVILIHQHDPELAHVFEALNYPYILEGGMVRDGKGEGMLIGLLVARMMGKEYIGFIDSDNYMPGAVNEYVKIYAAGMLISESPYTMVRIAWRYKPKVAQGELYFAKWGRISEHTNRYLNMLIASHTGFETDVVKTGNSGEHAMSMRLAELLDYSSGFAVEPYELVYMMEEFGGVLESRHAEAMYEGVNILQIESRNPHLHEEKGSSHVKEMLRGSLASIYFSRLCTPALRKQILRDLRRAGAARSKDDMQSLTIMPSIKDVDVNEFARLIKARCSTLQYFGSNISTQMEAITT